MRVPQFELSEADESALNLAREYLEAVTQRGLKISTVDCVRWCIHRAAHGVAAEMAAQQEEGQHSERP